MPEEEKTSIQPTTGAIMDVQAPKNANTGSELSEPSMATSGTDSTGTKVTELAVPTNSDPNISQPDSQSKESPLAVALGDKTAHHGSKPVVAIIFAAVVALLLAGLTVFAFQKSQTKTPTRTATNTVNPAAVVKASDVDQTSSSIDASLQKIDDTKDLTATDLTEASLGL